MSEVYKLLGDWLAYAGGVSMFMGIVAKCINIMIKAFVRGELVV